MPPVSRFFNSGGVDAVVDELLANVVERLGDAANLRRPLSAVRQRALQLAETQIPPPRRRIRRLLVAGLGPGDYGICGIWGFAGFEISGRRILHFQLPTVDCRLPTLPWPLTPDLCPVFAADSNSIRASRSRVSVISWIICSNRCRNTNSRAAKIARN